MKAFTYFLFLMTLLVSCKIDDGGTQPMTEAMYFPPIGGNEWETKSISSLKWNQNAVQPLKDFLTQKNTKSFMILVNGRIVMEEYFDGHTASSEWEWNSAGKTLSTAAIGIAQQEDLLNINKKVSDYLGTGWTSMPLAKENLITVRHLLTMTSGIQDSSQLVIKSKLTYVADAGQRWAYGNVFQKLMDVVAKSSNQSFDDYLNSKLKSKIGLDGYWDRGVVYTIYNSTSRGMARFGLLALNKGKWNATQVVNEAFFTESTSTSNTINPSYGYLWWLNGKSKFMIPNSQTVFPGALVPDAPADMYAAMGARDQRIYVVPSKKMVVIRMGATANPGNANFAVSGFDNELWGKINALIN
jgi:CubicO group peptidase (beta-lactamase class C family)